MKILQIHNFYKSGMGGEDSVLNLERNILEENGHEVGQFFAYNSEVASSGLACVKAGFNAIWSRRSNKRLVEVLTGLRPDIVHVHNTFAVLSPSIYWAVKSLGLPVVLTLHNYRLVCATSLLLRDNQPCHECIGRFPWAAFLHRCKYAGSFAAGAQIALTKIVHNLLGTYQKKVDGFIALTEFAKNIMIQDGLPEHKFFVKPNFNQLPDNIISDGRRDKQVVYVGQMSEFKGVDLLLEAWTRRKCGRLKLIMIGDGPVKSVLEKKYTARTDIIWLGRLDRTLVLDYIARSLWLVLPSRCYEGFGMVIVEALSVGTPVIIPAHGPMPSLINNKCGVLFAANDCGSLRQLLDLATTMTANAWESFSREARRLYLEKYTPHRNYELLMEIYNKVIEINQNKGRVSNADHITL